MPVSQWFRAFPPFRAGPCVRCARASFHYCETPKERALRCSVITDEDAKKPAWSRTDKIARLGLVVAVVTAIGVLIPYAIDVYNHLTGPAAAFAEPVNGSAQTSSLGASGTAHNIPLSDDLWLAVRSGIEARWYPVERLVVQNGHWSVGPGIIWPASGTQELQIIMLSDSDEASFINYVQAHNLQHKNPGLSNLPPGYQVLKTVQIEVHN